MRAVTAPRRPPWPFQSRSEGVPIREGRKARAGASGASPEAGTVKAPSSPPPEERSCITAPYSRNLPLTTSPRSSKLDRIPPRYGATTTTTKEKGNDDLNLTD